MPPFKAGLLKRKNADKEENADTTQTSEDAAQTSDSSDAEGHQELDMSAPGIPDDSGDSSELEDSDDDDSEEDDDSEDGDDESEDDESEQSDASQESGLGETHSGSSEVEPDTPQASLLKSSKKILKKKAASTVIITRSKSKDSKESGVEHSEGTSSDEQVQTEGAGAGAEGKGAGAGGEEEGAGARGALAQLTQQIAGTHVTEGRDEYSSGDTSDEEDRRNPRGAVPAHWYDEMDHVGYDLDGRRMLRPAKRSAIDDFLKRCDDPEFWRTVRDPATGQDVLLSGADLALLQRLRRGAPPPSAQEEYQPWSEWFSSQVLAAPVRAFPEHKRSFLPSGSERAQLARLVHALRAGWRHTRRQLAAQRAAKRERKFYDLWGSEPAERGPRSAPPPRRALPAHAESYNPPPEYLLDSKELKEWNKLASTPWKRKYTFLPQRHASLRAVAAFPRYTRERFLRCLDLYLAPRAVRMRLTLSAHELVPQLPSPRALQPFPTREALRLRGHGAAVRCCSVAPEGRFACSGSDDGTLKVWELATGRCLRTIELDAPVTACAWAGAGPGLVAAAAAARLLLLAPLRARAAAALRAPPPPGDPVDARTLAAARWEEVGAAQWTRGVRACVAHGAALGALAWHARGDYLAAAVAGPRGVVVHQVSRRRSQLPLARAKGAVQDVLFHPHRPFLFVATQRVVRVYDLVQQTTLRTLRPGAQWISRMALHPGGDHLLVASYDRKCLWWVQGAQWISRMALHPGGDHLLVASYDRKCLWFDLDLSGAPYQALRLHGGAVRAVAFHPRYPLFATAGDDRVVVCHGTVYNDLLQNPLLVPLKQLAGPGAAGHLNALALAWHPQQPWLLVAGALGELQLLA